MTIELNGTRVIIDITFPSNQRWDGACSMAVACGNGTDYVANSDPDAEKRALENAYCDRRVREPFIAALGISEMRTGDSTGRVPGSGRSR
ncbi:hypothetical protein ABTX15_32400 [Micromonospora sp. NPDC094482]|uniref:hypothetical protein n=1 Tax=unclassified Micromonospora TaxID=2617518 RepID=UPI00331BE3BA